MQEAGVDEPDIVKTDGKRIVAVAQARVHLVGLDGGKMTLRKTLPTRWFAMCFFPANVCLCSASDGSEVRAGVALGGSAGRSDDV